MLAIALNERIFKHMGGKQANHRAARFVELEGIQMKCTNELLELSEFSQCAHPLTARLSFYLDHALEDVADERGLYISSLPTHNEEFVCRISFNNKSYMLCQNGEIKIVTKSVTKKTGRQTWNGDDQFYDEVETKFQTGNAVGEVLNFIESCETKSGIENIAVQILDVLTD